MSRHFRCPDCGLHHRGGRCHPLPMWPTKPLVDRCGGERALQEAMGATAKGGLPDMISDVVSDRWATKLGLHPNDIWPGWSDAGLTPRDRRFLEGNGWRQAWLWNETHPTESEATA